MTEDSLKEIRQQKKESLQEDTEEAPDREDQLESIRQKAYQHMTQDAISRLGRIRTAKPSLAESVASQIARLGQTNQINNVDDETLKTILKQLQDEKQEDTGNISFRR